MNTQRFLILAVTLLLTAVPICRAQTGPDAGPSAGATPPTEALAKFAPFVGLYALDGTFLGEPYHGTLEIRPAVKGWYVEWTFLVHNATMDRELRVLATWDRAANRFRIWRFETDNPLASSEGTARFDGDAFVMEWRMPAPDGKPGTLRSRTTLATSNKIVIVTEGERDSGGGEEVGRAMGIRR